MQKKTRFGYRIDYEEFNDCMMVTFNKVYVVGYYNAYGIWVTESRHQHKHQATTRARELNGGK